MTFFLTVKDSVRITASAALSGYQFIDFIMHSFADVSRNYTVNVSESLSAELKMRSFITGYRNSGTKIIIEPVKSGKFYIIRDGYAVIHKSIAQLRSHYIISAYYGIRLFHRSADYLLGKYGRSCFPEVPVKIPRLFMRKLMLVHRRNISVQSLLRALYSLGSGKTVYLPAAMLFNQMISYFFKRLTVIDSGVFKISVLAVAQKNHRTSGLFQKLVYPPGKRFI